MTAPDVDDRIRRALQAQAELVKEADLRPALAPTSTAAAGHRRWQWSLPLLAAAAVAALAIGTTAVVSTLQSDRVAPGHSSTPSPSLSSSPSTAPTQTSHAPTSAPPSTSTKPSGSPNVGGTFTPGYQPLWPFADYAQAELWRTTAGGSQPWHADPEQTALSFTQGYLGFAELKQVTSHVLDAQGAHIGVGYLDPNGKPHTSALLHLVRFGTASDAPWEVVGSDDTTFSLEQPAYGSTVSSPVTVGGHITGADESIRVSVRRLGVETPVGQYCCLPAGGNNSPWSHQVSFTGSGVITIVASTGGHLLGVERFAIQGVTAN
jgi:hypothetical protein